MRSANGCANALRNASAGARRWADLLRGLDKVRAVFIFAVATYNIVRLPKLLAAKGEASLMA